VLPGGAERTYRQLAAQADALGTALQPGDLAAIECDNSPASLAAYLGCVRRDTPVALLAADLDAQLRERLYGHFGISSVFRPAEGWLRLRDRGPAMHPRLALLLSTSGSTGAPKLVRLSMDNLLANARSIAEYLSLDERARAATLLPQQYSFGLSVIHSHLLSGASLALTSASVAERAFWNFFEESRANSLSGVPATFEMLRRMRIERMALPHLRTLTQAGGRLAPASVAWFAELARSRGWRLFVMYGQTEATARIAYLPPEKALEHPDSIGQAIPGGRIELLDAEGRTIERAGEVGELVYHGPNVMLGYAQHPDDLARGDEFHGRLRTGDLAERDAAGLHYIRGRLSRFVKVFGNRVGLDDVEARLQTLAPGAVATGRDDLLVLCGTEADRLAAATQTLAELYRIHKSAITPFAVTEIPRNESGKVLYADILALFDAAKAAR